MSELSGSQQSRSATGRLKTGPAPALVRSANRLEVSHGPVLYRGLSLGDMAHVIVLMEVGVQDLPVFRDEFFLVRNRTRKLSHLTEVFLSFAEEHASQV